MFLVILGVLLVIASIVGVYMITKKISRLTKKLESTENNRYHDEYQTGISVLKWFRVGAFVPAFLGFAILASTSFVYVDSDSVLHLQKIYGTKDLSAGQVIASDGEKGKQVGFELVQGFKIWPLVKIQYDTETLPVVEIPAGFYGRITAKDGKSLPDGAIMASGWDEDVFDSMLDATYFLTNGGEKGLQSSILKPGKYRMNLYLFDVRYGNGKVEVTYTQEGRHVSEEGSIVDTRVTEIPAGHVGVVKSNLTEGNQECKEKVEVTAQVVGALSAPLVPQGCKGVWRTALYPGAYYMNKDAYDITLVNTRVQTWQYEGGFTKRFINLKVEQDGTIIQTPREEVREHNPEKHADQAIYVKMEGWDIPLESRIIAQISPENAPIVVAAVGGLQQVEDTILTPTYRSITRNVTGSSIRYIDENGVLVVRETRVLDLIENRELIETNIEQLMITEGRKAGVDIKEVRFGEPAIPPELLVARQREQLSQQLKKSYDEEKIAQDARIQSEKSRAEADQQSTLVTQQIANQRAELKKVELHNLGEGEKLRLTEIAEGQKAQALVLGEDKVLMLEVVKQILATLESKPELVSLVGKMVPHTVVMDGQGLSGPAAILSGALGGMNVGDIPAKVPSNEPVKK